MPAEIDEREMQALIAGGDWSGVPVARRQEFYEDRCGRLGLEWRTSPFEFILLPSGKAWKLTLYCKAGAIDSLCAARGLSREIVSEGPDTAQAFYRARVRVSSPDGKRRDEDIGVVSLKDRDGHALTGDSRANAEMKAVTKAKRRAGKSYCGLGFPDESEIGSIAGARLATIDAPTPSDTPAISAGDAPKRLPSPARDWAAEADALTTASAAHDLAVAYLAARGIEHGQASDAVWVHIVNRGNALKQAESAANAVLA